MKTKSNNEYAAINTRIPIEAYELMKESLEVTKKSVGAFVADAVVQYTQLITNPGSKVPETNAMQIDKFAWQLKNKS